MIRLDRIKWTIVFFKSFKTRGHNQIFRALLKERLEQAVGSLMRMLRICIAMGYTPRAWRLSRIFIPKA